MIFIPAIFKGQIFNFIDDLTVKVNFPTISSVWSFISILLRLIHANDIYGELHVAWGGSESASMRYEWITDGARASNSDANAQK